MPCVRSKPLALVVCCSVAGLSGIVAGEAAAQALTPLRVDPVLLGLPPVEKKPAVVPPKPAENQDKPQERARADVQPVEPQAVDARPLGTEQATAESAARPAGQPGTKAATAARPARAASPDQVPARAASPASAAPAVTAVAPAPPVTPAGSSLPVVGLPPSRSRTQEARSSASQPSASPDERKVTTLAPLQVHPGLLGLPSVAAQPSSAGSRVAQTLPARPAAPGTAAAQGASATPAVPPGGKLTTLAPLQVHPGLLGLPEVAAGATGRVPAGTVVGRVPSTLAGLAQNQEDAWRAGQPPVLSFSSEQVDLPDDGTALPSLRKARALEPLASGLPRPMFLSADELAGSTETEMIASGNAEARQAGTVVNADRLTYWPVEDEFEATGSVRLEQGEDLFTGPRLRMKIATQTGVFDEPTYLLKRETKWMNRELARQARGGADSAGSKSAWWQSAGYRAAWAQSVGIQAASVNASGYQPGRPDPGSLMNVLGISAEEPEPIPKTETHGKAERIDFEGENKLRIFSGDYSTCKPENPGWYVRSDELALDYDREVGEGKSSTVYFQDVPIFWTPWLSFSLNNQRKSGFLAPTIGSSTVSGLMLSTPYYWNIAPNMDATIAPRIYSKRGLQLASEYRYLSHNYSGDIRAEYLANDRQAENADRYGYSIQHRHLLGEGLSGSLNISGVSDDKYFTDLSSRSMLSSQRQLLRQGVLSYGGGWWNAAVIGQSYQTLNPDTDKQQRIDKPYSFAPRIEVNARRPDFLGADLAFSGQYTSFTHDTKTQGQRTVAYPQVSLPFIQPGWYVTPKFGVHSTNYALDRRTNTQWSESVSRTLPIFSLDAGMTFERETTWFGADATQTLEPRLYYLNVPYKDQSQIPNFDTSIADFNFAQIFSENQFLGHDRVSDANQLTAAVVSRLIDPTSGAEAMRVMFGQRYYFKRQQVDLEGQTIPGQTIDKWNRSDFLAAFSGRILPKTWLDTAVQYNPTDARMERSSVGMRYQPELGKTLNASYRFASKEISSGALKNVDVSGQWPIWGGWSAVGRYNYSILDHKPVETLAGLEYNGGCWAVRFVSHQVATLSDRANTSFFVQLELNDFARIGSNPLDLLRRNIQGFGLSNQPVADPVFGE